MIDSLEQREQGLKHWISEQLRLGDTFQWESVSGDASFRRYFRATVGRGSEDEGDGAAVRSWIAVDSPYDHEHNDAFADILERLLQMKVDVPALIAFDRDGGYFLLSDLGDQLLLPLLNDQSIEQWYQASMALLLPMQRTPTAGLPLYDRDKLRVEMNLFHEWFLLEYLQKSVDETLLNHLEPVYARLEEQALAQPQCFVHRDYHPRNLMVTSAEPHYLSVIDFQDAVEGAITYDLVSMLKNSYYKRPLEEIDRWSRQFRQRLIDQGALLASHCREDQWDRWFDFMGMQRHIKVVGIFARLCFRDNKPSFLDDIPRTLSYLLEMTHRYQPEFEWFHHYLTTDIVPSLIAKNPMAEKWFA